MNFWRMSVAAAALALCSVQAQADDWGCEVLLCLSNPAGPTAVPQCVPPIKRLWLQLAKGRSFPTCAMASNDSTHYATTEIATGENCPAGQGYYGGKDGKELLCRMSGAVTVMLNGVPGNKVWWATDGATIQEDYTQTPGDSSGGAIVEKRILSCTEAASMPQYAAALGIPNVTGMVVPDGARLYRNGEVLAIAEGGYANQPLYDGKKLLGYGYASEIRVITRSSTGGAIEQTSWRTAQQLNCDITNPQDYASAPTGDVNQQQANW